VLEAIENKFIETPVDRAEWPSMVKRGANAQSNRPKVPLNPEAEEDITTDPLLVEYWDQVRARHTSRSYLSPESPAYDLSVLPETWAVVSMSVTEDRNTMFISRHQNGHEPLVFCLPLDRQSKREGEEEDVFTFEAGLAELRAIIETSDKCSSVAKTLKTPEEKVGWWNTKRALDKRMKDLIDNVEFCWLGAFKVAPFRPEDAVRSADYIDDL
jgi:separase